MMNGPVIETRLAEAYRAAMERGRIVVFSAPCGFGKSVVSHALLRGCRVRELSADEGDFAFPADDGTWDVLRLDQMQNLPEEEQDGLCHLLRTAVERRFVLLSRGALPGWLAPFQFSFAGVHRRRSGAAPGGRGGAAGAVRRGAFGYGADRRIAGHQRPSAGAGYAGPLHGGAAGGLHPGGGADGAAADDDVFRGRGVPAVRPVPAAVSAGAGAL